MGMLGGLGAGLMNFSTVLGKHNEMNRQERQKQLEWERTQHLETLRMKHAETLQQNTMNHATKLQEGSLAAQAEQNRLTREQSASQFKDNLDLAKKKQTADELNAERTYNATMFQYGVVNKHNKDTLAETVRQHQVQEKRANNEIWGYKGDTAITFGMVAEMDPSELVGAVPKVVQEQHMLNAMTKQFNMDMVDALKDKRIAAFAEMEKSGQLKHLPEGIVEIMRINAQDPESGEFLVKLYGDSKGSVDAEDLVSASKEAYERWTSEISGKEDKLKELNDAYTKITGKQGTEEELRAFFIKREVQSMIGSAGGRGDKFSMLKGYGGEGEDAPTGVVKEYEPSDFKGILERLNSMSPKEQQEAFAQLGPKTQAGVMNLSSKQGTTSAAAPTAQGGPPKSGTQADMMVAAREREAAKAAEEAPIEEAMVQRYNANYRKGKTPITSVDDIPPGLRTGVRRWVDKNVKF